jgi:hypothetical protein
VRRTALEIYFAMPPLLRERLRGVSPQSYLSVKRSDLTMRACPVNSLPSLAVFCCAYTVLTSRCIIYTPSRQAFVSFPWLLTSDWFAALKLVEATMRCALVARVWRYSIYQGQVGDIRIIELCCISREHLS